ncbi:MULTISPECIES: hypothetical protein [Rhizobium]|uniref:Uncharacterized protein n=1 Tax=Rhizobium paranaense TaxID=1650438 RepID=A0A7W8XSW7_9HYPH|nr:hypothetical protein [Rhizobium paranaense]MBB5574994.1 hypothetical protein [Rhizobium paranaense]
MVSFIEETKLFYIPGGVLVELQADIARTDAVDPVRAAAQQEWYLVTQLPIATMEVEGFALINKYFPLPGIYNPIEHRWHSKPAQLADYNQGQWGATFQTRV